MRTHMDESFVDVENQLVSGRGSTVLILTNKIVMFTEYLSGASK